jgi:hypothetical protein
MKKLRSFMRQSLRGNGLNNNRGQGTAEYVLLLVIVVALVVMFRGKIKDAMSSKTDEVSQGISGFSGE